MKKSPINSRENLQNNSPKKLTVSLKNSQKLPQKLSQKLSRKNSTTAAAKSSPATAAATTAAATTAAATTAAATCAHPLKKSLAKVAITFSIIAISWIVTATSCEKGSPNPNTIADNSGNSGNSGNLNNNSGNNPNPKPIDLESFSSGNLQIEIATSNAHFIKEHTDNTIYINAQELEKKVDIVADPQDDQRGFRDLISKKNRTKIFSIYFPGHTITTPKVAMFFLFRPHVNKNTLTIDVPDACTNNSESADNALAASPGGGICRSYTPDGVTVHLESFLGTVFTNTNPTKARGLVQCESDLQNIFDPVKNLGKPIDDTTVFNRPNKMDCFLGVVNDDYVFMGQRYNNSTLDGSWALDSASTPEVEFYAIGINVTGKLISAWSVEPEFDLSKLNKALDNTAIKKILKANDWRDRLFKVSIVTSRHFNSL